MDWTTWAAVEENFDIEEKLGPGPKLNWRTTVKDWRTSVQEANLGSDPTQTWPNSPFFYYMFGTSLKLLDDSFQTLCLFSLVTLSLSHTLNLSKKSMAEINSGNGGDGDNGGNGDGSNEGAWPRDRAETLGSQIGDQTAEEVSTSSGAAVQRDGNNDWGHAAEVGDGGDRHTSVEEGRMPVTVGPEGPRVRRLDFRSSVEGLVVTGVGSIGAGSSGSGSDVQTGLASRDSTRGKDPAVAEEAPIVVPAKRVEFILPVRSSRQDPITSSDLAEFVGQAALARLMEESPAMVAIVMAAREERIQQIALDEEEERLRREGEELVRETETAEKA